MIGEKSVSPSGGFLGGRGTEGGGPRKKEEAGPMCRAAHSIQRPTCRACVCLLGPRRSSAGIHGENVLYGTYTSEPGLTTRNAQVLGFLLTSGRGKECIGGAIPTQRDTLRSQERRQRCSTVLAGQILLADRTTVLHSSFLFRTVFTVPLLRYDHFRDPLYASADPGTERLRSPVFTRDTLAGCSCFQAGDALETNGQRISVWELIGWQF